MCPCRTLRDPPYDVSRMTRGQDGSLLLSCVTLSFTTQCRFSPALQTFRLMSSASAARRRQTAKCDFYFARDRTTCIKLWADPPVRGRRPRRPVATVKGLTTSEGAVRPGIVISRQEPKTKVNVGLIEPGSHYGAATKAGMISLAIGEPRPVTKS